VDAVEAPHDAAPPHPGEGDIDDSPAGGEGVAAFGHRQLPRNVAAEQGLLGAIFTDNRSYERVSDFLRPDHFYLPPHQRIYEAVCTLLDRGQIADPTTLRPYFEQDDGLTDIGGAAYLANLTANAVSVINAKEYGRIIYECARKREIIALGEEMVNAAFESSLDESADDIVEMADGRLLTASEGVNDHDTAKHRAQLRHWIEHGIKGIRTGLSDMDRTCPMIPGDFIIVAGRPSMGKSAEAKCLSDGAAQVYKKPRVRRGPLPASSRWRCLPSNGTCVASPTFPACLTVGLCGSSTRQTVSAGRLWKPLRRLTTYRY